MLGRYTVLLYLLASLSFVSSLEENPSPESSPDIESNSWQRRLPELSSKPISVLLVNDGLAGHLFPLVALGEELVKRGHNVSMCAAVVNGTKLLPAVPEKAGIKFFGAVSRTFTQQDAEDNMLRMSAQGTSKLDAFKKVVEMHGLQAIEIRDTIESIGVDQFDMIVTEIFSLPIAIYYHKLGHKVTVFSSTIPFIPATVPKWPSPVMLSGQSDKLSFFERLFNIFLHPFITYQFGPLFDSVKTMDEDFGKVLKDTKSVDYPGIHIPLLINSVLGFEYPKKVTPLTHFIGPMLMASAPELDQGLQNWLSTKADKSVIYISMGTIVFISSSKAKALVEGVLATDYDTIWTLKESNRDVLNGLRIEDIPRERLYLAKWVAQQTVLKHRAIRLAILHCGLNGVQESLINALPVVCAPGGADQFGTAARIESAGVGISLYGIIDAKLWGKEYSAENVTNAILTVSSERYVENTRVMQKLYRFAGGVKTAANLIEYYAEVGYDHLVPAYAKYEWSWVQYYNVDVYLTILLSALVGVWGVYRLVKCVCCYCFCCCRSRAENNKRTKSKTE